MMKHTMQVETNGAELTLVRKFNAPRSKVFEAHTDCKHLKHWWGPREWPVSYCNMDFRVGGRWHYCMTGPEGVEAWGLMLYKEIIDQELIAGEDHFADKEGNSNTELPVTHTRNEFTEKDGVTTLRSVARYSSPEDLKKVLDMGMVDGIRETFDRLEEYLAR